MAIAFYEAARPVRMSNAVQGRFHDTRAGWTAANLSFAAELQASLCLMRLWENPSKEQKQGKARLTVSLPALASDLRSDAVLDDLAARATEEAAHLWGPSIGTNVRDAAIKWRDGILSRIPRRMGRRLARLRAYRNKRLAHRNPFDIAGQDAARAAEIADVSIMLAVARSAVREVRPLIDLTIYDPKDIQRIRRRCAESFWAIAVRSDRHKGD